jgi:hypothetical protein
MKKEHPGQGNFGPWRKSSFSNPNGNECVEVAWRKSSFSEPNGNACLEVAVSEMAVGLRDSKHPNGPKLVFEPQNWRAFIASTRPNN